MRLLVQTNDSYIITDVPRVIYERPTDTLVARDQENEYRIVILESRAFQFLNPMMEKGFVDLSEFVCTIYPLRVPDKAVGSA